MLLDAIMLAVNGIAITVAIWAKIGCARYARETRAFAVEACRHADAVRDHYLSKGAR